VNAVEIVHAFPTFEALADFAAWMDSPDPQLLEMIAASSGAACGGRCYQGPCAQARSRTRLLDSN
jgi:hypothetical protein